VGAEFRFCRGLQLWRALFVAGVVTAPQKRNSAATDYRRHTRPTGFSARSYPSRFSATAYRFSAPFVNS
jgi:hypothetical protein